MIARFILSFCFYHFIVWFIYFSTYSFNLTSRCSDWSCFLIDQMSNVDQMKLSQKFFVFLSRQLFDEIICWHFCSWTSININSICFNFVSQSMFTNINMFQLRVKLQHFFFQHAKNLTIVTMYVQFLHRIVLSWLENSFSSDCLFRDSTQNQ
jgi:hypothetical protein